MLSYTLPILTWIINIFIGINLGADLFTLETDLPIRVIIVQVVNVTPYYVSLYFLDLVILEMLTDLRSFYKPTCFILLNTFNIITLSSSFILMAVVLVETCNKFKIKLGKICLNPEDLDEVIYLYEKASLALSLPFLVIFTINQVLVTLVAYVCITGELEEKTFP